MSDQEKKKIWKLLPYQSRWVKDKTPVKVYEKSRRIGISWTEAYDSVMHAGEGGGNVYYQSYDKDMTRGFISDCANWAKAINVAAGAVGETIIDLGDNEKIPAFRLPLANGKEIVAMTSAARGFRSKGRPGDRAIVDEAAFVDDLKAVLKAAMAFRMWGGQVHILSTHNGEGSPFNKLVTDVREGPRKSYSLHRTTLDDAIEQGLVERNFEILDKPLYAGARADYRAELIEEYGEDAEEELFCVPQQGGSSFLKWGDIRGCEHPDAGKPELFTEKFTYLGIDIAIRRDLWVASIVEKVGDVFWVRELDVKKGISFSEQYDIIDRMVNMYNPFRIAPDQTNMGEPIVEELQNRYGKHRVEGVLFTANNKLAIATALKEAVEDRRLRIPDDEVTRQDLHSIKAQQGPTGAPRLHADRSETDGHGDRFWALALAVAAGNIEPGILECTPLNQPRITSNLDSFMGGLRG